MWDVLYCTEESVFTLKSQCLHTKNKFRSSLSEDVQVEVEVEGKVKCRYEYRAFVAIHVCRVDYCNN